MNLTTFQELSKRTMPFNGEPQNPIEFENMLGNYAMGLIGETAELFVEFFDESVSTESLEKEIGDVLHYAVGLAQILNVDLNNNIGSEYLGVFDTEFELMKSLMESAKDVSEQAKKKIYHLHEDDIPEDAIIRCIKFLYQTANHLGSDMGTVMNLNIDKLKTRYPDKFSVEDSIARVDTK